MLKSWSFVCLSVFLATALVGQQEEKKELTDAERITRLELQVEDINRALVALSGDGSIEISSSLLDPRLNRIELRLDRLEQQALRSSATLGAASNRMIDSRLRALESAMMRLHR